MANNISNNEKWLAIEVTYAKPEEQVIVKLNVTQGSTIQHAIELSGLLARFPEIGMAELAVGIFGVVCPINQVLKQDDRVEIYRPLLSDPKEARRQRAKKTFKGGGV